MLRPGDVLTHVDDQNVARSSSSVVVPKLLGPCGTEVKLSFKRREYTALVPSFPLSLTIPLVAFHVPCSFSFPFPFILLPPQV